MDSSVYLGNSFLVSFCVLDILIFLCVLFVVVCKALGRGGKNGS